MQLLSALFLVATIKTSSAQLSCPTDPTSYKVVDVPYGDGTAWDDDAWAGDNWTDDGHGKPSFEYAIVHDESVDGTDPSILCGKMTSNHLGMIAFGISPAGKNVIIYVYIYNIYLCVYLFFIESVELINMLCLSNILRCHDWRRGDHRLTRE